MVNFYNLLLLFILFTDLVNFFVLYFCSYILFLNYLLLIIIVFKHNTISHKTLIINHSKIIFMWLFLSSFSLG